MKHNIGWNHISIISIYYSTDSIPIHKHHLWIGPNFTCRILPINTIRDFVNVYERGRQHQSHINISLTRCRTVSKVWSRFINRCTLAQLSVCLCVCELSWKHCASHDIGLRPFVPFWKLEKPGVETDGIDVEICRTRVVDPSFDVGVLLNAVYRHGN